MVKKIINVIKCLFITTLYFAIIIISKIDKMTKNILITGATGLIGSRLTDELIRRRHTVYVLSRSKERAEKIFPKEVNVLTWENLSDKKYVSGLNITTIINLAGENVAGGRWTNKFKQIILNSRLNTVKELSRCFLGINTPPEVFIGASAIGFYGGNINLTAQEYTPQGQGFLADVTKQWEDAANPFSNAGVRVVFLRIGVVLDSKGGALAKMLVPFKLFAGGPIGSGKQWISWIHINDLVKIFTDAVERDGYKGMYNATAPEPVRMDDFAAALGKALRRPAFFRVPGIVIRIMMGEAASIVLEGAKVLPGMLLKHGFVFSYSNINDALNDLLRRK